MTSRKKWLTLNEVDRRMRARVATKLRKCIAAYDGSPAAAKEIIRGFVAARQIGMDLRPFEDRLAKRSKALGDAAA